jgi:hypothetical protein
MPLCPMRQTGILVPRAWPDVREPRRFSPRLHPRAGGAGSLEEHAESFFSLHAGAGPFGHDGLASQVLRCEAKLLPLLPFSRMLGVECRGAEVSCSHKSNINTGRLTVQLSMPSKLSRPAFV